MENIQKRLDDIYLDFEYNVTKVYGRRLMLMTYDLAWHSVIAFTFDGKFVGRGFLDVLVMGEPRCGKSEMLNQMQRHFNKGEIITGENVSKAGLVGGVNITDNSKMIIWGKYPRNNGRLVATDEYSNLEVETISALSGVRSSGIAEINKIISGRAEAKTRKISISNPRSGNNFDSVEHPIMLVKNLIGRNEDIARFDVILGIRQNDITAKQIAKARKVEIKHKYTSEVCSALVQWAWDLEPDQICFTSRAVEKVYTLAENQTKKWTSSFPMVVGPEQHERVARLAAALAARLFSCDKTARKLIVRPEHVDVIGDYMERLYKHPGLEYQAFTEMTNARTNAFKNKEKAITEALQDMPYSKRVLKVFLDNRYITKTQIEEEIHDITPGDAKKVISHLANWGLIYKSKRGYRKTDSFNVLLRTKFENKLNDLHFDIKEEELDEA